MQLIFACLNCSEGFACQWRSPTIWTVLNERWKCANYISLRHEDAYFVGQMCGLSSIYCHWFLAVKGILFINVTPNCQYDNHFTHDLNHTSRSTLYTHFVEHSTQRTSIPCASSLASIRAWNIAVRDSFYTKKQDCSKYLKKGLVWLFKINHKKAFSSVKLPSNISLLCKWLYYLLVQTIAP